MKDLVEAIARALVDHPEQVQVRSVDGEQVTVLELRVHTLILLGEIHFQSRFSSAKKFKFLFDVLFF